MSNSVRPYGQQPTKLLCPQDSPGKNNGVGCHFLLQHTTSAAKLLQSCPILCDPIDGSLPGSPVPGILKARTLEWVAISFSNACLYAKSLQSCLTLCNPMDSSPPRLLCPWDSLGKNTGVGCHFFPQDHLLWGKSTGKS